MVNFGIPYGISAFGLAQRLGTVSRTEAQEIIDSYFAQFPGIPGYMEAQKESAKKNGYVETQCGRRRYLRDINSANGTIRAAAERNAINMPIQGTAADVIRRAMIRMDDAIAHLPAKMLLQVHDELVFEVDKDAADDLIAVAKNVMENAANPVVKFDVPLVVDAGIGATWAEAH